MVDRALWCCLIRVCPIVLVLVLINNKTIFSFSNILFQLELCRVLTPYYTEEVLFSLRELESPNEDGVSILFYLQKIFPGVHPYPTSVTVV